VTDTKIREESKMDKYLKTFEPAMKKVEGRALFPGGDKEALGVYRPTGRKVDPGGG